MYLLKVSKQAPKWNLACILWLCFAGFISMNYGICIYGHQGPHIQVRSKLRKCSQEPPRWIKILPLPGASSVCVATRLRRPSRRFTFEQGIQLLRSTSVNILRTVCLWASWQHRVAKITTAPLPVPTAVPIARRSSRGRFAKKQKTFARRPCPCSSSGFRLLNHGCISTPR